MGSFNFKQKPHYDQQNRNFVKQVSRSILPEDALLNGTTFNIQALNLQKFPTMIQGTLEFPLSPLGLLRVQQPMSKKIFDGTCVLIASNILLTCAHNIYSIWHKQVYQEVIYYPCRNGKEKEKIVIKTSPNNVKIHPYFRQYETNQRDNYDYAIIILDKHLDDAYGCLQIAQNYKIGQDEDLYVFGYPVQENTQQSQTFLYGCKGRIKKQTERILYYQMETKAGHSGAPILVQSQGKMKIIGIHTVSDPSGIYINSEVAKFLNSQINFVQSRLTVENGTSIFKDSQPKLQKMIHKYEWHTLTTLILKNCNITSDNLKNLNKISWRIKQLNLDNNKIDCICLDPGKFRKMQRASLDNNLISKLDPSINNYPRLVYLSLKNNRIVKADVKIRCNLLKIYLQGNKCEGGMYNTDSYVF